MLDKFFVGHPDNRLHKKMVTQKIKASKLRLNSVLYDSPTAGKGKG